MSRDGDRGDPASEAIETVRRILAGDDGGQVSATFVRGLTLGALIGAAVAGSAIWRRGRPRRATDGRHAGPRA